MGYIAKFPFNSLSEMTDFSNITSAVMSSSTYTITSISVTLTAQSDDSITDCTSSVLIQAAYYIPGISTPPDIYYQTNSETYSLLENTSSTKASNLACSRTGSTIISYSISSLNNQVPSWISINSSSGELNIFTPNVTVDTSFSFYINSIISGFSSPIQKIVSINVLNWNVDFWTTCTTHSTCSICYTGYNLTDSNTWSVPEDVASEAAEAMVITIQSGIGLAAWILWAFSMINISNINNLWSMINQIQISFLLLLTGAYIPIDIKTIIVGFKFLLNPFNFISFETIPVYQTVFEKFNFKLSNLNFVSFGLKSSSSLYNTSGILLSLSLIILIHILMKVLLKLISLCGPLNSKWWCPIRVARWILEKLLIIMHYGFYIRFILQITQFLLVTSIYEIYIHQTSFMYNIISFTYAIFLLSVCFLIAGIVTYLSISPYKTSPDGHNKIGEFFRGISMEKRSKVFASLMIIRKIMFVSLLIFWMSVSSKLLINILSWLQLWYILYLFMTKPYKEVKGNIIEIINEIYFLLLLSNLAFWNEKSDWTSSKILLYSYMITSNSMITSFIIFGNLCSIIYSWWS